MERFQQRRVTETTELDRACECLENVLLSYDRLADQLFDRSNGASLSQLLKRCTVAAQLIFPDFDPEAHEIFGKLLLRRDFIRVQLFRLKDESQTEGERAAIESELTEMIAQFEELKAAIAESGLLRLLTPLQKAYWQRNCASPVSLPALVMQAKANRHGGTAVPFPVSAPQQGLRRNGLRGIPAQA